MREDTFADVVWQSRWNSNAAQRSALMQNGSGVMLVTPLGRVTVDLDKRYDVEAFCAQMERALEMLRLAKRDYDKGLG